MAFEDLFGEVGFWLGLGVVAALVVGLTLFLGRRKCPKCAARGSLTHVYERNGKRDRRFKHNPFLCLKCKAQFIDEPCR